MITETDTFSEADGHQAKLRFDKPEERLLGVVPLHRLSMDILDYQLLPHDLVVVRAEPLYRTNLATRTWWVPFAWLYYIVSDSRWPILKLLWRFGFWIAPPKAIEGMGRPASPKHWFRSRKLR